MTPQDNWSVDLDGWTREDDPFFQGDPVWLHTDYHGRPDIALAWTYPGDAIAVLKDPRINVMDVEGENIGEYPDWDTALDAALAHLELPTNN
jgi:hypothetical protein